MVIFGFSFPFVFRCDNSSSYIFFLILFLIVPKFNKQLCFNEIRLRELFGIVWNAIIVEVFIAILWEVLLADPALLHPILSYVTPNCFNQTKRIGQKN
jgi:hypothetical protein